MDIDFAKLAEPFPEDVLLWRVGNISKRTMKTTLLAYIDSRIVQDRLDDVVGPGNWKDSYAVGPGGGVMCTLSVRCGDEWVGKCDAAENTDIEGVKGGISDALKRAAVKWGIGRYLYAIDAGWCKIESGFPPRGGISVYSKKEGISGYCARPRLPAWALPPPDTKLRQQKPVVQDAPLVEEDGGAEAGHVDIEGDRLTDTQLQHIKRQLNRLRAPSESWPTALGVFLDRLSLMSGHPVKVLPEEITEAAAGPLIQYLMGLAPKPLPDADEEEDGELMSEARIANNASDNGDMV